MSIVSNLAPERVCKSFFKIPINKLNKDYQKGLKLANRIIKANEIAKKDIFRATTHNKGIMNGIIAVALSVG